MHRRLLIRPGAIGDCILALPELEAARADYTEVWAPRAVLPLIRFADRTRAIADTGLDLVGVLPGAQVPALQSFDSIYSWYGTQHAEFREAVRHLPFTFFPALPPSPQGVPRIPVPAAPVCDFAVIHPFSGGPKKNWPLENFRAIVDRFPEVPFVATGFTSEVPAEDRAALAFELRHEQRADGRQDARHAGAAPRTRAGSGRRRRNAW